MIDNGMIDDGLKDRGEGARDEIAPILSAALALGSARQPIISMKINISAINPAENASVRRKGIPV